MSAAKWDPPPPLIIWIHDLSASMLLRVLDPSDFSTLFTVQASYVRPSCSHADLQTSSEGLAEYGYIFVTMERSDTMGTSQLAPRMSIHRVTRVFLLKAPIYGIFEPGCGGCHGGGVSGPQNEAVQATHRLLAAPDIANFAG